MLEVDLEVRDDTGQAGGHLDLVRRVAERTVAGEGLGGAYQLSVTIVPDETIRDLNRAHRAVDAVTDVLSFPLVDDDSAAFVLPAEAPTHLGDVVIAIDRAREQAAEFGHSVEREIAYLTAHGVLHLLGYDHEGEADQTEMRAREEQALADLPR